MSYTGLPHLVMADDVYGNYRIPKDTVVRRLLVGA